MSIANFILARVDEAERAATFIVDCDKIHPAGQVPLPPGVSVTCAVAHYRVDKRVMDDCQAKRKIVQLRLADPYTCGKAHPTMDVYHPDGHADEDPILQALASAWPDHPDYAFGGGA